MQELLLSLQPANYGIPWHGFHRKIAVIFWTPSGKLTACYGKWINIAHLVCWFTELKDGDFP
jgi:hypothetical protein